MVARLNKSLPLSEMRQRFVKILVINKAFQSDLSKVKYFKGRIQPRKNLLLWWWKRKPKVCQSIVFPIRVVNFSWWLSKTHLKEKEFQLSGPEPTAKHKGLKWEWYEFKFQSHPKFDRTASPQDMRIERKSWIVSLGGCDLTRDLLCWSSSVTLWPLWMKSELQKIRKKLLFILKLCLHIWLFHIFSLVVKKKGLNIIEREGYERFISSPFNYFNDLWWWNLKERNENVDHHICYFLTFEYFILQTSFIWVLKWKLFIFFLKKKKCSLSKPAWFKC